eukprot:CAMPEP_0172871478 /NCGR_PEP_ID=MMETSP1075-20121228/92106_1 /TAXON_ID=2916 /ORGANISM="Ceratium fusus, Strain PA161109" /LENGTH=442 /DNA_ID=CAMNT_0013721727 /DNA_START=200 /DNA_END=1525 /DNA_ORIENTATION=+
MAQLPPKYMTFSTCRTHPSVGFLAPTAASTARQRSTSAVGSRHYETDRANNEWDTLNLARCVQSPPLVQSGRPPPRHQQPPNRCSSRPGSSARSHDRRRCAKGMTTCHSSPLFSSAEPSTACCHAKSVSDITSTESPPTPGAVGRGVSPEQPANFQTLVGNLRDAAHALQQVMPAYTSTVAAPMPRMASDTRKNGHAIPRCPATKAPAPGQQTACRESDVTIIHDQSLGTHAVCTKPSLNTEKLLVPAIERLAVENAALKQSVAQANERLSQLEEEKQRFLDEAVYDLVNSVCGKRIARSRGSSPLCGSPELKPLSVNLSPTTRPTLAAAVLLLEEAGGPVEFTGKRDQAQEELTPLLPETCTDQAVENELHVLAREQLYLSQRWAKLLAAGSTAGPVPTTWGAPVGSIQSNQQHHFRDQQHQQQSWRSPLEDPGTSPEDLV